MKSSDCKTISCTDPQVRRTKTRLLPKRPQTSAVSADLSYLPSETCRLVTRQKETNLTTEGS